MKKIVAPEASKAKLRDTKIEEAALDEAFENKPKEEIPEPGQVFDNQIRIDFTSVPDQVAQSSNYFRNFKYPGHQNLFPHTPEYQMVDKYYPMAKGGPLLVDEPKNEKAKVAAYKKQEFFKKEGMRSIVIEEGFEVYDVMAQLGEY